jgi:hypothetical protein
VRETDVVGFEKLVQCTPYQYVCRKCKCSTGGHLERVGSDLKCSCGGKIIFDPIVMNCKHLRLGPERGNDFKYRRCLDCNTLMKPAE